MARPPADKVKAIFKAYRELTSAEKVRFKDALDLVGDEPGPGRPRGSRNKSKSLEPEAPAE